MKNTDQALGVQCTCMHGHGWETGGRSLRGRIHSEAFHTGHARQSALFQSEKLPHDPEGHQLQGQAWKHGASTWKVLRL